MPSPPAAILGLVLPVMMLAAAARDATSFTIPNWIPLGLVLAFPLTVLVFGFDVRTLAIHLAIGGLGLMIGIGLFALRAIGGGDAKLLAAAMLWLGWPATAPFLLITVLAGGLLAAILLGARSAGLRPLISAGPAWVARLARPGEGVPYGVAIAVGALMVFPKTPFATPFAAGLGL
jgi:prepilin peptidase CpaA